MDDGAAIKTEPQDEEAENGEEGLPSPLEDYQWNHDEPHADDMMVKVKPETAWPRTDGDQEDMSDYGEVTDGVVIKIEPIDEDERLEETEVSTMSDQLCNNPRDHTVVHTEVTDGRHEALDATERLVPDSQAMRYQAVLTGPGNEEVTEPMEEEWIRAPSEVEDASAELTGNGDRGDSIPPDFKNLMRECMMVRPNNGTSSRQLRLDSEKLVQCPCPVCGKDFYQPYRLKQHLLVHTGLKPFECTVCGRAFNQQSHLSRHRLVHSGDRPFYCKVCDKTFKTRGNLKKHQVIHSEQKPFPCDLCDRAFKLRSHLKQHLVVHSGEKPFSCDICEKTFNQRGLLNQHLLVHSGEKPYSCQVCRKAFNSSSNLKKHQILHTGLKPYQCDVCQKSFGHQSHLKRHRLIHSGYKPHHCEVCEKTFGQLEHLKQHQVIHSGERPFPCGVCHKAFTQRGSLRQHQLRHTAQETVTEEGDKVSSRLLQASTILSLVIPKPGGKSTPKRNRRRSLSPVMSRMTPLVIPEVPGMGSPCSEKIKNESHRLLLKDDVMPLVIPQPGRDTPASGNVSADDRLLVIPQARKSKSDTSGSGDESRLESSSVDLLPLGDVS